MALFESKILGTLSHSQYQPLTADELARDLNVTKKSAAEFRDVLDRLIDEGRILKSRDGLLRLRPTSGLIQGTVRRTAGGTGFVVPRLKDLALVRQLQQTTRPSPRHGRGGGRPAPAAAESAVPQIYIHKDDLGDAYTGDEVLVRIIKHSLRMDGSLRGKVVEIIQRATRTFVGTYFERSGQGFVQVDGTTFAEPISVGDPGAKGAQPDDKVVFEMLRFPSQWRHGEGVLTKVLGARGDIGVDTLSIIHEFGLPDEFPPDVLADAQTQADRFDEKDLTGRRDLTGETIVTIDPVDARDFDDAISLTKTDDGHWHLGVHIADVAHFVPEGSLLDDEATRRGTSVYLPDRVLPMLPELISNGLASLQQGRVRYTQSAFMEYTAEGVLVHTEFARSAIKVTKRFAYEAVMPIVEDPDRFKTRVSAKVRQLLSRMYEFSQILRTRRFVGGALELTLPEVKIDLDKHGKVAGAHVAPHDPSHQIIEEFMLAANMAVAQLLTDRGIPFLRRVHADPDEFKLRALAEFANSLGYPLKRFQSRLELQQLLDRVRTSPHRHAINYALLRSLKQAEYSPEPLGHYALAVENYCHFTSPIRRYPDLTIHRLFSQLVTKNKITHRPSDEDIFALGQHCSRTERRAEQAERELTKVKLLTYMSQRIGERFHAVITGVQDWGFYCQAEEIPADGLVHVTSLDDDYYYFEQATHSLIGRRTGRSYRLGEPVQVVVARVDIDRRQLDFLIADSRAARAIKLTATKPVPLAATSASLATPMTTTAAEAARREPRGGRPGKTSRNAPPAPSLPPRSQRKPKPRRGRKKKS